MATVENNAQNSTQGIKVTTVRNICSVVAAVNSKTRLTCPALVNKVPVMIWIDTGSDQTLMNSRLAKKLELSLEKKQFNIKGANNLNLNCNGAVKIELEIKLGKISKKASIEVVVVEGSCSDFILGMDYIISFKLIVNTSSYKLSFEGEKKWSKGCRTCYYSCS